MPRQKATKSTDLTDHPNAMEVDSSDEQPTVKKGGKKTAKASAKAKGKVRYHAVIFTDGLLTWKQKRANNVDDESDGETMQVDAPNPRTEKVIDELDGRVQAARFSINVLDMFNPPKPIRLGVWNPRELKEGEATKLKNSLLTGAIRAFRFENMFNIIIDKKYVDPECIQHTIQGGNQHAPLLKLTEEGLAKVQHLDFAGGRHRLRAMDMIKNERAEKLKKLQDQIRKERNRASNLEHDDDRLNAKISRLDKAISDEAAYISKLGKWGVMLFDSGMRLTF